MQAPHQWFALALASLVTLALSTIAAGAPLEPILVNAKNIKWGPAPPDLPKGAKVAVLFGDPTAAGQFVMRISLPSKYKMPFHWHSQAQRVTVISGTVYIATTETYDKKLAHAVKPGGFVIVPARAQNFAFTKGAAVMEIHGDGPFDVKYTNPSDDPQMGVKTPYYFPKEFELNELNAPEGAEPIPTF
jgi:quercetin dioxygenase-like cupin family protein